MSNNIMEIHNASDDPKLYSIYQLQNIWVFLMFINRNVIILILHRIQDFSNMEVNAYLCMLYKDFKTCQTNLYGQGAISTKYKSIPFFPSIYLIFFSFHLQTPVCPPFPSPTPTSPIPTHHLLLGVLRPLLDSQQNQRRSFKTFSKRLRQRDCKFKVSFNYEESSGPVRKQKTLSHKKEK